MSHFNEAKEFNILSVQTDKQLPVENNIIKFDDNNKVLEKADIIINNIVKCPSSPTIKLSKSPGTVYDKFALTCIKTIARQAIVLIPFKLLYLLIIFSPFYITQ